MENPFSVSLLNDFIFCPASIYFHLVDASTDKIFYESKEQQEGSSLHEKTDSSQYSDRKNVLQGVSVYCEQFNLSGKIDNIEELEAERFFYNENPYPLTETNQYKSFMTVGNW